MESRWFFYAGPLSGSPVAAEEAILDCYRLARQYSRDPDEFLNKPLSAIKRHIRWTAKLLETQQAQQDDE